MKKSFSVTAPGKDDARVRDKIRHEINKYAKRERLKTLPEGADRWEFTCRVGATEAGAEDLPLGAVGGAIDKVAAAGAAAVFVEIVASPRFRRPKV